MNKYIFTYTDSYGSITDSIYANSKEKALELAEIKIKQHIILPLWKQNITIVQARTN